MLVNFYGGPEDGTQKDVCLDYWGQLPPYLDFPEKTEPLVTAHPSAIAAIDNKIHRYELMQTEYHYLS